MTPNPIIVPLLSLAVLTACIAEPESGTSESLQSGEIDRLVATNGNVLVFIDEDPSDAVSIALVEIAATPEPGGAIEEMKAAGATPAELWLSMTDKEVPRALAEAHADERVEAPRAFTMPDHLRETTDDVDFRAFAYGGEWGDYDGYCSSSFASDWDMWATAAADASASGTVGSGVTLDLYMNDATDAWVGVCNNTPWNTSTTLSSMTLYRDISGNPTWGLLSCSGISPSTWCVSIGEQIGKGMHYWSGTTYDFKAQAARSGGVDHDVMLRVRSD